MKNKKNVLTIIFMIAVSLMVLTACTNKQTQETKTDNQTLSLKLSDNLPDFIIHGNYTKGEVDIGDGDFETLWAYDGDDNAEYRFVHVYKWAKGNESLFEATVEDAQYYFPEQSPNVITCNYWNEPNDYEYTYYAAIKDNKFFVQNWAFQDGDYFYQICVAYDLVSYTIDGTNIQLPIPKHLKKVETNDALMKFEDPDYEIGMCELPNVEIFLNDADFEYSKENITKTWEVENVEISEYTFNSNDYTKQYPGYIIECQYTENGKTIVCYENAILINDKYLGIVFSYDKDIEFREYLENSYKALLYPIAFK